MSETNPAQEHYAKAERLLAQAAERTGFGLGISSTELYGPQERAELFARAQIHATLAQAASNEMLVGHLVANSVAETLKQILAEDGTRTP